MFFNTTSSVKLFLKVVSEKSHLKWLYRSLFTHLCLQCFLEKGKNPSKPFKFLTFWKRMYFENERTFSKGFQGKLCHHYSNCPQNLHNAMVLKNWQIFIPFIARPKEQFCCSCQIHIKFSSILFASNFGLIFLWNWLSSNVPTNPITITRIFPHWPMEQI